MTARSRPPTDDSATEIYDSTQGGPPRPRDRRPVEMGTPTEISPEPSGPSGPSSQSGGYSAPASGPQRVRALERPASGFAASPTMTASAERSEPLRVISMKGPGDALAPEAPESARQAKQHQVRLRPMAEVSRRHATPPSGLGYLAPPRDPREARTRRWRDYVIWGSAVVIVGCAVMIGVWLLARS